MSLRVLRRRVSASPDAETPYAQLPFDVPEGTRRLEISYRYPGQDDGSAAVDLGLIDPRGGRFPELEGFRGWSGTFRRSAIVTEQSATPGYVPGPILAGRWHVLLGLYRLPGEGAEVEVAIEMSEDAGPPAHAPPAPPSLPTLTGGGWIPGELHSHTHHSDAPGSLEQLVAEARAAGLRFLAVTDHNTVSHLPYLASCPSDLLLVPGMEVTTYRGHMNVWGTVRPIDFRCHTAGRMRALIDHCNACGWLCSASHPAAPGLDWSYGYEGALGCLEVWHGPSMGFNAVTLQAWDELLRAGRHIVAVGGGDHHTGRDAWLARPTVWVRADHLAVPSIIDGLRRGRVVVSESGLPLLQLEVEREGTIYGPGDTAPAGTVLVRCPGGRPEGMRLRLVTALGEVEEGEVDLLRHRYVRAELRHHVDDPFPLAALTNPVWAAS